MERCAEALALLGTLVLAVPVWKAGQLGRRLERTRGASLAAGSHPSFRRGREALERRLKPNEWTHRDQNVLYLGYGLTFSSQVLALLA